MIVYVLVSPSASNYKTPVMKKPILTIAFLLLYSSLLLAYPISPRPLRKMISESEYIIHGNVIKLGSFKQKKGKEVLYRYFALIAIKDVLQGKISMDTIKVFYPAGLICPAPPAYMEGVEAIIFLDRAQEKGEQFVTHALSYGVKNFDHMEGVAVYKQRILEMQHILLLTDEQQKHNATMEWLVNCAANKYTCWEGTYELSPDSDFMSYYDDEKEFPKEASLKADQRKKLMEALLQTDTISYAQIGIVDIVRGIDDNRLLNFLKSQLSLLGDDKLWWAEFIMQRIVQMTGDADLKRLYLSFNEISLYDEKKQSERKELFVQFKNKMKDAALKQVVYAIVMLMLKKLEDH